MLEGFDFGTPKIANQLTGTLEALKHYNGLSIPPEYFIEAMGRLRERYLNVPLSSVLHPASPSAQQAATRQKAAADAAPAVQEEALTAQQWFERGFAAMEIDEKLRFYGQAILIKPDYAVALYNRGLALNDKGDLDGALRDLNEATRLLPYFADAFNARGVVRGDKGDLEGALQDYSKAVKLNPADALAFSNRGEVRLDRGDPEGGLEDCNEAIRLRPDLAEAFHHRSRARLSRGDFEGAQQDRNEAIRLGFKLKE
jgi:tetratricopeptide (TPR) repeat protein